ncbi:hypothetical protein R1flu_016606 [Riccia fluitans]|uniref:Uncharacterized protein n=1 Tax=Riccia fluitans TaxID=41844 RepID=A0ABD1YMN1_9MARC
MVVGFAEGEFVLCLLVRLMKVGAEVLWNFAVFRLKLLLLTMVLGIGWCTTSEDRNVPYLEVVSAVSLRDGVAGVRGDGSHVGKDPQLHMFGSGLQTLAISGRKLKATHDDHVKSPFISFDYPDPGENTPIIDPPTTAPHETASGRMHMDYADPGTHPPGNDDSDEPPIDNPPVPN